MIKNSLRTCLYTNKQYDKKELIRLVKENNKLVVDHLQNKLGRGYWIKLSPEMINDPKLMVLLSKRTKGSVDQKLIDELKQLL